MKWAFLLGITPRDAQLVFEKYDKKGQEMGERRGKDKNQRATGWNQDHCSEDTASVHEGPPTICDFCFFD